MFKDLALQNDDGGETLLRPGHEELLRRLRKLISEPPMKAGLAEASKGWDALSGSEKVKQLACDPDTRG